jgi:hypothetical protein
MFFSGALRRPSLAGGAVLAEERPFSGQMVLPTLDAEVETPGGQRARVSQIVDTGSGVNLILNLPFVESSKSRCTPRDPCYCDSPGTVAEVFGRSVGRGGAGGAAICGVCQDPGRQAHQNAASGPCNSFCCLEEGASCEDSASCTASCTIAATACRPVNSAWSSAAFRQAHSHTVNGSVDIKKKVRHSTASDAGSERWASQRH